MIGKADGLGTRAVLGRAILGAWARCGAKPLRLVALQLADVKLVDEGTAAAMPNISIRSP